MLSGPRPEFFVHFLAVTSIGAIWVGPNPRYTAGKLDHIVGDADPAMLFGFAEVAGENQFGKLRGPVDDHPAVRQLVIFDDPEPTHGVGWETFLGGAWSVSVTQLATRRAEIDPMDPAYLVHTSGSTGRPANFELRARSTCTAFAAVRRTTCRVDSRRTRCGRGCGRA